MKLEYDNRVTSLISTDNQPTIMYCQYPTLSAFPGASSNVNILVSLPGLNASNFDRFMDVLGCCIERASLRVDVFVFFTDRQKFTGRM